MKGLEKENVRLIASYISVLNTTPEVPPEKEMDHYFEKALERVKK